MFTCGYSASGEYTCKKPQDSAVEQMNLKATLPTIQKDVIEKFAEMPTRITVKGNDKVAIQEAMDELNRIQNQYKMYR